MGAGVMTLTHEVTISSLCWAALIEHVVFTEDHINHNIVDSAAQSRVASIQLRFLNEGVSHILVPTPGVPKAGAFTVSSFTDLYCCQVSADRVNKKKSESV